MAVYNDTVHRTSFLFTNYLDQGTATRRMACRDGTHTLKTWKSIIEKNFTCSLIQVEAIFE